MFQHRVRVKMFHFTTTHCCHHTASDWYIGKWDKRFDQFIEAYQGSHGRIQDTHICLKVDLTGHINDHIDMMIDRLKSSYDEFGRSLETVLVEMVLNLELFKYKLTLN